MRRHGVIRQLQNLPKEKQILALASIVTAVSCFLPWYGINSRIINEWWNAFGSIGSVAGYVILSFSVISLALIVLPALRPQLDIQQKLPIKESSLLVFLSAQSFFVSLIFVPVYAQYSLINAINSGSRFGIYIALVSTLVSSIVSFSYHQRLKKGSLLQEDFVSVPRAQRSVADWEESEEVVNDMSNQSEFIEQETIFSDQTEEVAATDQDESQQTGAVNSFGDHDEYRNLYS